MPEPDVQHMCRLQVYDRHNRLISYQMSEFVLYTMSAHRLGEWLVREGPSYLPAPGETVVFVLTAMPDDGARNPDGTPFRVGVHGEGAADA